MERQIEIERELLHISIYYILSHGVCHFFFFHLNIFKYIFSFVEGIGFT